MGGFRPVQHRNGSKVFTQREMPCVVSGAVFIGDPLRVSSGVVKPIGTAVSAACIGVAAGFLNENHRPFTHNNGSIHKLAAVTAFAMVYDDPGIIYEVQMDGTASAGLIGAIHNVSAGTPSTAAGQSGYNLTDTAASAGDGQFVVVGVSQDVSGGNAANSKAFVTIKRHVYDNGI